jgi:hypothetical protein
MVRYLTLRLQLFFLYVSVDIRALTFHLLYPFFPVSDVDARKELILQQYGGCLDLSMYQNAHGWRFIVQGDSINVTRDVMIHMQRWWKFPRQTIMLLAIFPGSLDIVLGMNNSAVVYWWAN